MNNDIQEDYCSFEIGKLLKEKGCKLKGKAWAERTQAGMEFFGKNANKVFRNNVLFEDTELCNWYPRPTHALAIKWIRENFGIHISIHHWTKQPVGDEVWKDAYQGFINGDAMDVSIYKTHEDATEAALLYTLQKLIP